MPHRLWIALLIGCGVACGAGTDLTVPPPRDVPPGFRVEVPAPRDDGRLPKLAEPRRYRLHFDIDPEAQRFTGVTVIDVVLEHPTSAIVLHGADLTISRAEVLLGAEHIRAETTFRKAAGATRDAEELVLVAARELPAGDAQLHIEFTAPLTDSLRGVYRAKDGGKTYVFTQFEPSDARRMFPCFDDPVYKVPFELEVAVPKGNLVFSNAPEKSRKEAERTVTFTFEPTKPMPTYLVALAIGPLEVREGAREPVPIRLIAVEGKSKLGELALTTAAEHLAQLSEYFARPYPYNKLDLVAVPNFGPGAMENAGLVTFREELLLVDSVSAKTRRDVAVILAHELSHQWFGNLVTMQWWDDLWLNEGFATYMETLIVDRWQPSMRAGLEMLSMSGAVMDIDALDSARAVRQPVSNTYQAEEAFDGITYVKGASVLRMLNRWLGDEPFRQGVRAYMGEHAWGNANAGDLFRALGQASKQDVAAVASTFLDQPGVPLVNAQLSCTGKPTVKLSQRRYRARPGGADDKQEWKIPVCVAFGSGAHERACTLMSGRSSSLELPAERCPEWLLPNAGYEGYYRYAMAGPELSALGRATLKQDAAAKIGYLANLWALVQGGDVEASELFDMLLAMKRERDRVVVEEMIGLLHQVSDALVDKDARNAFQSYVSALLLPTGKALGWDARRGESEDDKLLRRSVLSALATLTEEPWMLEEAKKRALPYLEGKGASDPDGAAIALRVMAHRNQPEVTFDKLVAALNASASSPARRVVLVQSLGSLGDAAALRRALALVDDGKVRAQDALYIMRSASDWPASRAVFIEWLQKNLGALAERFPGFGVSRMMQPLRRVCDAEARAQAARAFEPLVQNIGGLERRLHEALESASLCVNLRARQSKKVTAYLRKGGF